MGLFHGIFAVVETIVNGSELLISFSTWSLLIYRKYTSFYIISLSCHIAKNMKNTKSFLVEH